jgi:hypothetical protein
MESQTQLCKTIMQYIPNILMTDSTKTGEKFSNQFKN